ncbi:MAG: putative oxidoreductase C-terminal domain-containing protein [Bacteroidales bacterium]
MKSSRYFLIALAAFNFLFMSCNSKSSEEKNNFTGAEGEVKIIELQPGHFHSALVLKEAHPQIHEQVHVYASEGPELNSFLELINTYNTRDDDPTQWETDVYKGDDYLEKALQEKKGNVMVTAGNNARKTDYILQFVEQGINVLADKPMVISPDKFDQLLRAFEIAEENGVLLYDIMTERSEINTILQKKLAHEASVFGSFVPGTPEEPTISKESVHHFFKYVSGSPLVRPAWFFDVEQQGEGIVDVTTHLVDLVQWQLFPGQIIDYKNDIEMLDAERWPTLLSSDQFERVTQLSEYPDYLDQYIENDTLEVFANGAMNYQINGLHAHVSVVWDFEAPEGAGDTHYSVIRGTKSDLIIRQGEEENYRPVLYVKLKDDSDPVLFEQDLNQIITEDFNDEYPGLTLEKQEEDFWMIGVPDQYRIGHEAHFGEVMERYLQYLVDGKLPEWEVPNMIAKYYTNMQALEMAKRK